MGVINWVGSKVAKYGFGFKGVTSNDVKIIRKYFPIRKMYGSEITDKQAFALYHKAKADDLSRLADIIEMNRKNIMKQFKNNDIQVTSSDLDNILLSLRKIIQAKREHKSKSEMQKLIEIMLAAYEKSNPEWFDEANFREDVLRF